MKKGPMATTLLFSMVPLLIVVVLISCSNEVPWYTVNFNSQGGSVVNAIEVLKGSKISKPEPPTKVIDKVRSIGGKGIVKEKNTEYEKANSLDQSRNIKI